ETLVVFDPARCRDKQHNAADKSQRSPDRSLAAVAQARSHQKSKRPKTSVILESPKGQPYKTTIRQEFELVFSSRFAGVKHSLGLDLTSGFLTRSYFFSRNFAIASLIVELFFASGSAFK